MVDAWSYTRGLLAGMTSFFNLYIFFTDKIDISLSYGLR